MKKKKELTQAEAIAYCWENLKASIIGDKAYHKYMTYKRRHEAGETLNYNALHKMFADFGITTDCKYYLDK